MSLKLMRERVKMTGITPREEMIYDGQNLLKEEIERDVSFQTTMYFYDSINKKDIKLANLRVQNRKYSSLNGNYMDFLTTYDNNIKVGDYIHDIKDDTYWLVYTSFNVDNIHYEGRLIQCNYLLKWQLSNGSIVSRWCNIASASKYDVGENVTSALILSTNTYSILIGYCDEGLELEEKRVFIDVLKDNPTKVFKITRNDDVLYNYGNIGSLLSFIADKTEFNKETDNQELRICNYFNLDEKECSNNEERNVIEESSESTNKNTDKTILLSSKILGKDVIKITVPYTFTANLYDDNDNELEWNNDYNWNIISDFDVNYEIYKNKIEIEVEDNEELIGKQFVLQLLKNNNIVDKKVINIIDII